MTARAGGMAATTMATMATIATATMATTASTAMRTRRGARHAATAMATTLLAMLAACGGGSQNGDTPLTANLDGTLPTCTIADGASSCTATVVWSSSYANSVQLIVDGTVLSTAAAGTASPTVTYGTPISVTLQAGTTTVGPKSITANCAATSGWDGTQCRPLDSSFSVSAFAVADGDTNVSGTLALTGTATQSLLSGSATIACADADDATATLPVTVDVAVNGTGFTVAPTFQGYAMLPHHARCTLSVSLYNAVLAAATFGPISFTTDEGTPVTRVFARAGANGLPYLVDPATGAASSPSAMAAHLNNCWGAEDRHLARLRTLCAKTSAGADAVWDIDPATGEAVAVPSLTSIFAGNVSEPDVAIDHRGTAYMTRGGLQADGSTNSMVVVITFADHQFVTWDWGGRQDYVVRLLLDDAAGRVYAVTRLGFVKAISTTTYAVTDSFDAGVQVNDATLVNGRIVMTIKATDAGANLVVYDPAAGALVSGVPVISSGRSTGSATLAGADLVVSTTDLAHNVLTGQICRLDPVTFALRDGTPCTAVGDTTPLAMTSDGTTLYGDLGDVLNLWPVTDFSTATALATFGGPITRLSLVQN